MVKNRNENSVPRPAKQGIGLKPLEPNKIKAFTPYEFQGRNLTAYRGLLPVATMLAKHCFLDLIAEALTVDRSTNGLSMPQFIPSVVLASHIGFSRRYHMSFLQRDPMLTGILGVRSLPP